MGKFQTGYHTECAFGIFCVVQFPSPIRQNIYHSHFTKLLNGFHIDVFQLNSNKLKIESSVTYSLRVWGSTLLKDTILTCGIVRWGGRSLALLHFVLGLLPGTYLLWVNR